MKLQLSVCDTVLEIRIHSFHISPGKCVWRDAKRPDKTTWEVTVFTLTFPDSAQGIDTEHYIYRSIWIISPFPRKGWRNIFSFQIRSGRTGSALGFNYASRMSGQVIWCKCTDVSEEVNWRSRILWNVHTFLPDYTVSCHFRRFRKVNSLHCAN